MFKGGNRRYMAEILTIRRKTISNQSIKGVISYLSQSENDDFNLFYHNFDYTFINTFYVLTALLKIFPFICVKFCIDLIFLIIFLCFNDYK